MKKIIKMNDIYTCVDPLGKTADGLYIYIYIYIYIFSDHSGEGGCFGRPWDVIGLAGDGG